MVKKKNAIMLADTRPALVGQVLIQLKETNSGLFDEAIIYYMEPISQADRARMGSIMPCRFVQYAPSLPDALFEKPRFKHFSHLMFCRYEMFSYLDEFETITWLDTDILIQGDLSEMIDAAKKTGAAFIREDPVNKTAENPDRMRTCFTADLPGYKTDKYLYCSGTIVFSKKIKNAALYTQWCYEKTCEWADILSLPDQGVINAAIQQFDIQVTCLSGKTYCCYPYRNRDCSQAKIIHSWGSNKFWNDWYIYLHYAGWKAYYEQWLALGGTPLAQEIAPAISVVIPSYKPKRDLLSQCLDSLMAQNRAGWERYSDFEVIIVAEPFEQEELRETVAAYHDKRIRLEFNDQRLGIAASLNRGLRMARGKYIARVDDDDLCAPDRLFRQMRYLEEHPDIVLCTSDFNYFGDLNERRKSFEGEMCRAWSIFTCPFDHPTIMFRKNFFTAHDLYYDEKRGYVEDWELWCRAFDQGMTVGCIHDVLFYHRWMNTGSAGQTNKTVDMMRELIQKNFLQLSVEISMEDLPLIGPWNGRIVQEGDRKKLEEYFTQAAENNRRLRLYDQTSLEDVFALRLAEARTGILPGLAEKIESARTKRTDTESAENVASTMDGVPPQMFATPPEQPGLLRRLLKGILKPLYRPFRHRYEDRLIDIQENVWVINGTLLDTRDQLLSRIDQLETFVQQQSQDNVKTVTELSRRIQQLSEQVAATQEAMSANLYTEAENTRRTLSANLYTEAENTRQTLSSKVYTEAENTRCVVANKYDEQADNAARKQDEFHRHIDFTYRDLMVALERVAHYLPEANIQLETDAPIAYESLDHLFPHGTIRDNTRYPRFVSKCEELLGTTQGLSFLDLGCSGGGMVLDAALRGHISMGLEGSDCSLKEQRAEWRLLGERLRTCDITKPFELKDAGGERHLFDVITAWEVMEHIAENALPQLLKNIHDHLSDRGYFIASIANWDDIDPVSGVNWHVTVHPYIWWKERFETAGFEVHSELLNASDLARGGFNPPHCYEEPYPEIDEEKTFHIVVQKACGKRK